MAVTHADLAPTHADIGCSKRGVALMVLSILLGLLSFVLCLIAEATRSQIVVHDGESCRYNGNGKTPLICAAGAFLSLAIAMVVQHTHLLLAVSKSDPDPTQLINTRDLKTLTWQATFFFITTWICFSVGEVLLLIGLSVESGHLKAGRPKCLVAREGLFSSAGVLGITTVFLASGLSITTQCLLLQDKENHVINVPSPPVGDRIIAVHGETSTPIIRHDLYHEPGLIEYLRAFDKII